MNLSRTSSHRGQRPELRAQRYCWSATAHMCAAVWVMAATSTAVVAVDVPSGWTVIVRRGRERRRLSNANATEGGIDYGTTV